MKEINLKLNGDQQLSLREAMVDSLGRIPDLRDLLLASPIEQKLEKIISNDSELLKIIDGEDHLLTQSKKENICDRVIDYFNNRDEIETLISAYEKTSPKHQNFQSLYELIPKPVQKKESPINQIKNKDSNTTSTIPPVNSPTECNKPCEADITLNNDSLTWSVKYVYKHSDGDLFPKILEMEAIKNTCMDFVNLIAGKSLENFSPGASRRFIVSKGDISYRQATQLDPQDNIILSALIYQFGQNIENRRLAEDIIYSYRFQPDINHGFYSNKTSWNDFWKKAYAKSRNCKYVLYSDISDFYNQICHDTLENQLKESQFPNQAIKWLMEMLKSTTAKVPRGIPVGPHGVHLLAEATMIPIDNCMQTNGLNFIRYVDDILVFCDSKKSVKKAAYLIAYTLDKQQRLTLQKNKTKIYTLEKFADLCKSMVEDRPISDEEDRILKIVKKHSGGDPYKTISHENISKEDWEKVTNDLIEKIINEYLRKNNVDYIRLRWFYRRLSQIGHPGAVEISIDKISKLEPCIANICYYLASVQSISPNSWKRIGDKLINLLSMEEIQQNEYFKLSILSLFTKNQYINHFSKLATKYSSFESFAKREILLAAKQNRDFDWIKQYKEDYQNMDPWLKSAFVYAMSGFPEDEKKSFLNSLNFERPFEKILAKWAKK